MESSDFDERRRRLATACMMAGVKKVELAAHIGVTEGALRQWEHRGDGHRRNALTAERLARAITELGDCECPPEALQAGSTFLPQWVQTG